MRQKTRERDRGGERETEAERQREKTAKTDNNVLVRIHREEAGKHHALRLLKARERLHRMVRALVRVTDASLALIPHSGHNVSDLARVKSLDGSFVWAEQPYLHDCVLISRGNTLDDSGCCAPAWCT